MRSGGRAAEGEAALYKEVASCACLSGHGQPKQFKCRRVRVQVRQSITALNLWSSWAACSEIGDTVRPILTGDTWTISAIVGQDNAVIPSYPDAGDLGLTGIFTIGAEILTPVHCFPLR